MDHLAGQRIDLLPPTCAGDAAVSLIARCERWLLDTTLATHWLNRLEGHWPPRKGLFAALLSARAAYRSAAARGVAQWGVCHGVWSDDQQCIVESALCEAVANAIVHGCLGLPGMDSFGTVGDGYFDAIENRLADDAMGGRPLGITIRRLPGSPAAAAGRRHPPGVLIHIDDSGNGYDPRLLRPNQTDPLVLSGRGHTLMEALAHRTRTSRGGRRITLEFRR